MLGESQDPNTTFRFRGVRMILNLNYMVDLGLDPFIKMALSLATETSKVPVNCLWVSFTRQYFLL